MLKEIVIAVGAYFRAHQFIVQHRLWKWILVPGVLYMLLFLGGMYIFWESSDAAVTSISHGLGLDKWVHEQESWLLSFLFLMGELMVRLIIIFFYFSLFKYLFLIIDSPLFAYLSERTEAIMEGKDFAFDFRQFLKDIYRGVALALRNTLWQSVFTISIFLLSFVPVVGWITPLLMLFLECYYYGFSMIDYSCERQKLSPSESIEFIAKHKGLAVGNGMIFYGMHLIPVVGWIFAPAYAVVAATISLYPQQPKT